MADIPQFEDVNSYPAPGILGFFGIKSQGRVPRPLDSLQFTFPAEQFYFAGQEQWINLGVNVAAVGPTAFAGNTVPLGKGWMVTGIQGSAASLVGEVIRFKVGLHNPGSSGAISLPVTDSACSSLADAVGVGQGYCRNDGPFIASPGSQFYALVEKITTAGTIAVNLSVRYIEFPW